MRPLRVLVGLLVLISSTLRGQTTFESAVASGDAAALQQRLASSCSALLLASQNRDSSASYRAETARKALNCARTLSTSAQLIAAPEKASQVASFFSALQADYDFNVRAAEAEEKFLGYRWGLGLGVSVGADASIDDATIADGVVRVASDRKDLPRVLFEYHKYFWCQRKELRGTEGCGPFVALASSDRRVVSGVGLGFMYGRRNAITETEGFSIGVGAVLDAAVRDLGDGFTANEPPPGAETTVRFATRSRWSLLLLVSRTF